MAAFYADFETRLEVVPFVAGEAFSAADITAFVTVEFATAALKMPIPDTAIAIRSWHGLIAAPASSKA